MLIIRSHRMGHSSPIWKSCPANRRSEPLSAHDLTHETHQTGTALTNVASGWSCGAMCLEDKGRIICASASRSDKRGPTRIHGRQQPDTYPPSKICTKVTFPAPCPPALRTLPPRSPVVETTKGRRGAFENSSCRLCSSLSIQRSIPCQISV